MVNSGLCCVEMPSLRKLRLISIDALQAADHQALQIQLGRDAQVKIDIERVVMRDEGPRRGAAVNGLQHRRLHFQEAARFQLAAQRRDDLRARDEHLADFGIGDQIEITLAVARLDIFQAMPLFRHREQRLGEEIQMFDVDAQLVRSGCGTDSLRRR